MLATVLSLAAPPLLGALAAGSPGRRAAAVTLGTAALALPFYGPEIPLVKGLLAVGLAWTWIRVTELAAAPGPPVWRRVALVVTVVELRHLRPAPAGRRQAWPMLVRVAAFAPVVVFGGWLAATRHGLARLAGGTLFVYGFTDAVMALLWAAFRAAGRDLPLLHRDPLRARSIGEFWRRWNTTVGGFLSARIHVPLARRGHPTLGLAAAFAVSAAAHAYIVWVPLGATMAAWIAAFFIVQLALVGLERALRVRRWPPVAAHAWTISAMAVSSPLTVEPLIRVIGW